MTTDGAGRTTTFQIVSPKSYRQREVEALEALAATLREIADQLRAADMIDLAETAPRQPSTLTHPETY